MPSMPMATRWPHSAAAHTVWHTRPVCGCLAPAPCAPTLPVRRSRATLCRVAQQTDALLTEEQRASASPISDPNYSSASPQDVVEPVADDSDVVSESYSADGSDPNVELESTLTITAANTRIKSAEYVRSCVSVADCPAPEHPEIAVIGRSNVGKSSLINMLTNSKKLAHVSKEPGKTRCINHFLINKSWFLVDLPGYGFARTGFATRQAFEKFTREYFLTRPSLALVYLLVDSSIAPQPIDLEYAAWLWENKVPFALVFTKADKRKKSQSPCRENVASFKHTLTQQYGVTDLPPVVITSSASGMGRTPLLHLTCAVRDAFLATDRIDNAMIEWQRAKIRGASPEAQQATVGSDAVNDTTRAGSVAPARSASKARSGTGKASSTPQGGSKGGKAAGTKSFGSSGSGSGSKGASASASNEGGAGKAAAAVAGKSKAGGDRDLPQWTVRARDSAPRTNSPSAQVTAPV